MEVKPIQDVGAVKCHVADQYEINISGYLSLLPSFISTTVSWLVIVFMLYRGEASQTRVTGPCAKTTV